MRPGIMKWSVIIGVVTAIVVQSLAHRSRNRDRSVLVPPSNDDEILGI